MQGFPCLEGDNARTHCQFLAIAMAGSGGVHPGQLRLGMDTLITIH